MSDRIVAQLTLSSTTPADARAELAKKVAAAGKGIPGVVASHAGVHFDLSVGGGDLTWDLAFDGEGSVSDFSACVRSARGSAGALLSALARDFDVLAPDIESVDFAIPEPLAERTAVPDLVGCLLYTSPSPRDLSTSRMPSSA